MTFSFIQITDHHILDSETALLKGFSTAYAFRAVLRHIAENHAGDVDFIVSTGDLVDKPTEANYHNLGQMLQLDENTASAPGPLRISIEGLQAFPFYCLPGNHDDRDLFFRSLFPQTRPARLMNAAFIHKGVQFICLDLGPRSKAELHAETLDFLARSLHAGLPAILLLHHALVPIGSRWLDAFLADTYDPFWQIVSGRAVLGIFCGHVHNTYETSRAGHPHLRAKIHRLPLRPARRTPGLPAAPTLPPGDGGRWGGEDGDL